MVVGAALPAAGEGPEPDPGFLEPVPADKCTPETQYEKKQWNKFSSSQSKACERLRFSYGPITVKPGQNDVLLGPVTIEKPWYDGYITRFKPDLVDASGQAPPAFDQVHLHHGTWLNGSPQYGNGPFFAAGEEKTILPFPKGYGMQVGASDSGCFSTWSTASSEAHRGMDHLRHRLRRRGGRREGRHRQCETRMARRAA